MHLSTLLRSGRLPDAALRAAAVHPDQADALAAAPSLPDDVFLDLWDGAGTGDEGLALALVPHVDRASRRHHVLVVRDEDRPAVLAALLATVVPTAGWRRRNAHRLTGPVADAVLGNDRWPLAEQAEVVGGASVVAVLRWAAHTDPDAPEVAAAHDLLHVRVDPPTAPPLTELPVHVVREAVLRWPVVARLALALSSCRAWAAVAAVTDDAGTLAWLVDRGARTVDPIDGAPLLEALWCNPTLPTDIRRRLLRVIVAGRVRCHYARPTPELDRPDLAEPPSASRARVETVLQWAERALDVRHLTTWAVARCWPRTWT